MSDLRWTPELHDALHLVANERVVHHSAACAHIQGWGWASGGHMPPALQEDLDNLWHALLIQFQQKDPCGDKVVLSFTGSDRHYLWGLEHPRGVA